MDRLIFCFGVSYYFVLYDPENKDMYLNGNTTTHIHGSKVIVSIMNMQNEILSIPGDNCVKQMSFFIIQF